LFGLVQEGAVFLSDSYKRMDLWKKQIATKMQGHEKLRRLTKIGKTRWWSKDKALSSVFELPDKISNIEKSRFITFLEYLRKVVVGRKFDCKARFQARSLINNWEKFDTIFIAVIILDLFSVTTSVSKYLQSSSLDYL